MTGPWAADHAITVETARALIEEQFPQLAPADVTSFAEGWDNALFLVNDAWVFRFPRREIAVPLLATEVRVLPAIASRLPVPVPVPGHAGVPGGDYPWSFAGYALLPGRPMWQAGLDDASRMTLAAPLAAFLAALHAIDAGTVHALGAGPDTIRRLDVAHRVERVRVRLARAVGLGLIADRAPLDAIADAAPADWRPGQTALVHGDLHAGNILVDHAGRVTGIIDWGDVHVGDPIVDVSVAAACLPPAGQVVFRAAYGPINDESWRVARLRGLFTTMALLLYAHDIGETGLAAECRLALTYLAAASTTMPP